MHALTYDSNIQKASVYSLHILSYFQNDGRFKVSNFFLSLDEGFSLS